jgi:holo-[acyl-carrier protein] synthase
MTILGHGIDLVSVQRIAEIADRHGERFLARCFTPAERGYSLASRRAHEHLAARFAAKEAALKALGTGWRAGIAWTDAEVISLPSGQPTLLLHGRARQIADEAGIQRWLLSLTHADGYAAASAIALGRLGT